MSFKLTQLLTAIIVLIFTENALSEDIQTKQLSFQNIERQILTMESPQRFRWQKPEKVVDYLALKNGNVIADIGAGSGYFTVLFSKKVGDLGKVYAVDIEKKMLEYIESRVEKEGLNNIQNILAKPDDPLLPDSSVDMIFLCNTYSYIHKRADYLNVLKKSLKHNGRIAIVDFVSSNTPIGPPPDQRVSREIVIKEMLKAGFKREAEYHFLPFQYFLIFSL